MNAYLADAYNTLGDVETNEASIEKIASIALIEKLAENNEWDLSDVDLSEYSEAELQEALESLVVDEDEDVAAEVELDKESAATFAEYDYYGRQMAHAFYDELNQIEKVAAGGGDLAAYVAAMKGKKGKGKDKEEKEEKGDEKESADSEKEASVSALDVLAEQRALELIEEHGLDNDTEKTASDEALADAVEHRAFELLVEHGWVDPSQLND